MDDGGAEQVNQRIIGRNRHLWVPDFEAELNLGLEFVLLCCIDCTVIGIYGRCGGRNISADYLLISPFHFRAVVEPATRGVSRVCKVM